MDQDPEALLQVIYEGVDYEDPSHLKLIYASFKKGEECRSESEKSGDILPRIEDENVHQESRGLEQLDRILEMKRDFKWIPVPKAYHTRFQKSPQISTLLRDRATKFLYSTEMEEQFCFKKSLRGYNLAIAFAPPNSAEVALALEKRADLLLRMGHPHLAQLDIQAVAGNPAYPLKSMKTAQKLISLQTRCSNEIHAKASKKVSTRVRNREARFVENNFYRLQSRNPMVENVSEFCDIDYDPHCGRRIIVTRDVEPGELIMVDEPYSIILERILSWDLEHCTNCSRPVISGLPCDCCTFAWFCSTTCKMEGTRGPHKYEKYLSYLKSSRIMSLRGLLAARLLFKVGPEELYKIFQSHNPFYFLNLHDSSSASILEMKKKGCSENEVYTAKSYLPIFHLISHHSPDEMKAKSNTFKALILSHLIEDCSDFFNRIRHKDDFSPFKDFIASLLLRHMEAIEYNAITLSQLVSNPKTINGSESTLQSSTLRYGAGVYPVLCLVNHSCDPNCVPVRSLKFLKTAVIAVKPLKAGDEVTFSYAPHFSQMELSERRNFLLDRYNFVCRCEACAERWGPDSRTRTIPESQCYACGRGRYLLTGKCGKCAIRDEEIRRDFPIFEEQLTQISQLIQEDLGGDEYLHAFALIKPCLKFCYENLPHNSILGLEFQELFKLLMVKLVSL